jgi:hypothetical protein
MEGGLNVTVTFSPPTSAGVIFLELQFVILLGWDMQDRERPSVFVCGPPEQSIGHVR